MIEVKIVNCGKKFHNKWVFKNLDHSFEPAAITAVTGTNGSGKSTLIKIISGFITPTNGIISWKIDGDNLDQHEIFRHLTIAAPYLETIEEFTFSELINFQKKFKAFRDSLTNSDIIRHAGFWEHKEKKIKYFSSGMKQRANLALAIFSASPLLLLDEPCVNLDSMNRSWYAEQLRNFSSNRTVIIASNHNKDDYPLCDNMITL